ncbi:hypothetical protein [Bacillus anthracis]|uniref:hypothetical protein n=1 Tax=Bacillus anthracis TaxID=1392 RepID=UPI0015590F0E|nr:hypothetical protein [Bacillus anthracis]
MKTKGKKNVKKKNNTEKNFNWGVFTGGEKKKKKRKKKKKINFFFFFFFFKIKIKKK